MGDQLAHDAVGVPAMTEESIFAGALGKKTPQERAAYLDAACAGDDGLRRRVEALLASDSRAGSFLLQAPPGVEGSAHGNAQTHADPPGSPPVGGLATDD